MIRILVVVIVLIIITAIELPQMNKGKLKKEKVIFFVIAALALAAAYINLSDPYRDSISKWLFETLNIEITLD